MCTGSQAPHCRTVLQNGLARQKHLLRSNPLWNTCQDFLKIPSLWDAALDTERRCFSKVILKSNATQNITRSLDPFSTVLTIVNAVDLGCIVRDLETIIVLVLLTFNFIPQRSQHSLTLTRSCLRDSTKGTSSLARSLAVENLLPQIVGSIIIIIKISYASPSGKNGWFTKLQSNPTSTCTTEKKENRR